MKLVKEVNKKKNISAKLIIIVVVLGILTVCAVVGFMYYNKLNDYVFQEPAVYYVNGIDYQLSPGDRAVISDDGQVQLKFLNGMGYNSGSLPAYFIDRDAVLTLSPLGYYESYQDNSFRGKLVPYFTDITCEYGDTTLVSERKEVYAQADFLFDGNDTYIILNYCELFVGDEIITLSPLSYVVARYNNSFNYYDYESDTYVTIDQPEDYYINADVYFPIDGITLHADQDTVDTSTGKTFKLISAITQLNDIFR